MEHDEMYFVINGHAITIDEVGTPVICDMNPDGTVDWDSFDLIDWMDLLPNDYDLFKAAVDFLQTNTKAIYVK
jgi:hypothetical protein